MTPPQGALPIERMCALTGVSRASYYRHWRRVAPRREQIELRDVLQRLAVANRHYGYRRLNALLRRAGWVVNHKRVLRLLRTDNLLCLRRRAFVPATTDSHHDWQVVPNLARGMQVTGLDQLWVADITYVRLLDELAFLAVVLDAFSRRVVGWAVEVHLRAALAVAALQMAMPSLSWWMWNARPACRRLASRASASRSTRLQPRTMRSTWHVAPARPTASSRASVSGVATRVRARTLE
jgi:transposase InsO family protein